MTKCFMFLLRIALPNEVTYLQNGLPVGLQQQLAGSLICKGLEDHMSDQNQFSQSLFTQNMGKE